MRGELHLRYQRQSHARGGDSLNTERQMAWDKLNRLMALPVNDKSRHYTYNAASERMASKDTYSCYNAAFEGGRRY